MIVTVLRWRDGEIEPGQGFWLRKTDTERTSLVLLGPLKQHAEAMQGVYKMTGM